MANEYYLRYPSEQAFYKILGLIMGLLCLNTQYWGWLKLPKNKLLLMQRFLMPICVPICCVSQVAYLALNYKEQDFAVLAVIFSILPVALVMCSKVMTGQTKVYKKVNTDLMEKIHLYNYYARDYPEDKHNYVAKILITTEKNIRYTFYLLAGATILCYCSWMIVPIIHNIQNNNSIKNITTRLELTIYFWQPYDYEYNFYGYVFFELIGIYCGALSIAVMVTFDTLNLIFVGFLVGHIKIFKFDLKQCQTENMNDKEWRQKLTDITNTYYFITKTFKDVEAAFGFNVATIYAQNLIQGGLLLYQLMSAGRDTGILMTYGLMIPIFGGVLLMISLVLESVRIQADEIPNLVYNLPWESMTLTNQKMVLYILLQVQPTLEFKAAFNIKAGIQPAISIIKTTFSYYVMIKSRKEM